jgi:hypothetical protein
VLCGPSQGLFAPTETACQTGVCSAVERVEPHMAARSPRQQRRNPAATGAGPAAPRTNCKFTGTFTARLPACARAAARARARGAPGTGGIPDDTDATDDTDDIGPAARLQLLTTVPRCYPGDGTTAARRPQQELLLPRNNPGPALQLTPCIARSLHAYGSGQPGSATGPCHHDNATDI